MKKLYPIKKGSNLNFLTTKFCFLLTTLFIINNIGHSQTSKIKSSLHVGVSMNTIYDPSDWTWKFSPYLIGAGFDKMFKNKLGVSTDLYFIRRGTHSEKINGIRQEDYRFDYIVISPNVEYYFFKKSDLKLRIGPYFGINLNAKVKWTYLEPFTDYKHSNFDDFDYGLNASLRKNFQLGKTQLFIEPRIQYGLNTFSNSKHKSIQFITGIIL